jgi:hypothetical protein
MRQLTLLLLLAPKFEVELKHIIRRDVSRTQLLPEIDKLHMQHLHSHESRSIKEVKLAVLSLGQCT